MTADPTGVTRSNSTDSGPLGNAEVIEKSADSCPYISRDVARDDVGYRLDRITVLVQAGITVGCRFYTLQHPNSECDHESRRDAFLTAISSTAPAVGGRRRSYFLPWFLTASMAAAAASGSR